MRLARFSPLLLAFSIIFLAPFCYAGTYYANSCSYADLNDCINGSGAKTCHAGSQTGSQATHTAVDGDTINIPSGSCTWTTGIVVPSKHRDHNHWQRDAEFRFQHNRGSIFLHSRRRSQSRAG